MGACQADARRLRDVIDSDENEIKAAGTNASLFQINAKRVAEIADDLLQILCVADWLGKTEFYARNFRRNQRRQRLLERTQCLIKTYQNIVAKPQTKTRTGLAGELGDTFNANVMK